MKDKTSVCIRIVCLLILTTGFGLASNLQEPVSLTESGDSVIIANGLVSVSVSKLNANIITMQYKGQNLMAHGGQAYWNVYGSTPSPILGVKTQNKESYPSRFTITQDPKLNGGEMGEFELLFAYHPSKINPPGGTQKMDSMNDQEEGEKGKGGAVPPEPLDIAIRYTLHRGDSGVYGWTKVTHKAGYPAFDIEASTVCLKLDPDIFDHLTVDRYRNRQMITADDWIHGERLNLKEARRMTTGIHKGEVEHKYDYSAMFSETPAYGWTSTTKKLGVWIIHSSLEYMQAPPTRIDLTGHIDLKDSKPADPTLLMIWHSFHYGGVPLWIDQDEEWNKVIGPFLIYCNEGPDPDAMWNDALARAAMEKKKWPYAWAKMPGYASAMERGAVTGKLKVIDPQQPSANASYAWVGLAQEPYTAKDQLEKPFEVNWETDGKHYEYWAKADASGSFSISNARPGTYTLYAFNDGILGDYNKASVTIEAGKTLDLGTLVWTPLRYGRQIWEIGIPNRSAQEFRHGNQPWEWGLYNLYPEEFPHDVNFIVGKSDWSKDWNYVQPGRIDDTGVWHGTTWKISFVMGKIEQGKATLRLALCGTRDSQIDVAVNGRTVGTTGPLPSSGVMHRDGMRATEISRDISFDTSTLVEGKNVLELTTHARTWVSGVLYDYLRFEINDKKN